jgi:hypothetical protein
MYNSYSSNIFEFNIVACFTEVCESIQEKRINIPVSRIEPSNTFFSGCMIKNTLRIRFLRQGVVEMKLAQCQVDKEKEDDEMVTH